MFTKIIEAVFPLWRYVPRIIRHLIGFLAFAPLLFLQNWLALRHQVGLAVIVCVLNTYLFFWSVGVVGLFLRFRRFTRRSIRGRARPLSYKWFVRHYVIGTFDKREDHE